MFHSRNSAPNADMYNGVQTLVYNDQGLKAELARNITQNLVGNLVLLDKGVVERPNLVVLKKNKMPAVLIEAGLLIRLWIMKSLIINKNEIAQAIADAIIDTLYDRGIHANDCKLNNSQSVFGSGGGF